MFRRVLNVLIPFILGASTSMVISSLSEVRQKEKMTSTASVSMCLEATNAARRLEIEARTGFMDQLAVSEQREEVINVLRRKLRHAKGNWTMAEKKLREIYGEKSSQDVVMLQLQAQLSALRVDQGNIAVMT